VFLLTFIDTSLGYPEEVKSMNEPKVLVERLIIKGVPSGAPLIYPNSCKIAIISIINTVIRLVISIISIPMTPGRDKPVNAKLDIYFTPIMLIA
jgi:hypothetical protein